MASIVLSAVGTAAGAAIGGPIGATIGATIGKIAGHYADQQIFGGVKIRGPQGPRLNDLAVQTSTYGRMIPIIYGTARIAGNIIWSRPIKEMVVSSSGSVGAGKGGGGKVTQSSASYSYSVTLAIALCEGPIDEVLRIWADAKQLDMSLFTVRVYKGDEAQLPDSLIQSYEGEDYTPAYRGLAYVVLEDFPLADFGNRIPNFTFEVKKRARHPDYAGETLEEMIKGMVIIPGAGEYVYDTAIEYKIPGVQVGSDWVQQGNQSAVNMHNAHGKANALLALDQLAETCPNVTWVAVVVSWFGDSLDAGDCVVLPGVEYKTGAVTAPDSWGVAAFTRATARQITLVNGAPQYGGTPDDDSVLRLLDELNDRGYKIMFYPMMFMDTPGKPWRGELTGTASEVSSFFTKTNGYNAFITHYANLVHDKVDAFVIGSELKGLTAVTATPGSYPAVSAFVSLATSVKSIVGDVLVTYAADWSEYHHASGGWYNLDPLWASSSIDMIGIDAYFPLTDAPQGRYDVQAAIDGWTSGEGYDWYYSDSARTVRTSLAAPYAWKNLEWFWTHTHTNPDSSVTAWIPESKPIWFTEYGFPSVDGAANQPNVFYDPSSVSSAFPYYSKGRVDFRAQRVGLAATQQKWKDSAMVERMFVWTWDARPYPYWPDMTDVWGDGPAWKTGHWVQGKLGISSLAAIIKDLSLRGGLTQDDLDVSQVTDQLEGYVITAQQTIRECIEELQGAYFFDAVESDSKLAFVPRGGTAAVEVAYGELLADPLQDRDQPLTLTRQQEIELPSRVSVVYLDRSSNYQPATQYSQRQVTSSKDMMTLSLPLVLSDQAAKIIADITLFSRWMERMSYIFALPMKYARLEPGDVMSVVANGVSYRMRILATQMSAGTMRVQAVGEDISTYDFYSAPGEQQVVAQGASPVSQTRLELLDLPAFPADFEDRGVLRFAASGVHANWSGSVIYRSDDAGANYQRLLDINAASIVGTAVTALLSGPTAVFDDRNTVTVVLYGAASLQSVSELAALNGANTALIGGEIVQFKTAALLEPGKYALSGLLRGRLGTEWAIGGHAAGERFVLLDGSLGRLEMPTALIGLGRKYKPVTIGAALASAVAQDFTYNAVALKPYAPVHISGMRDGSGNLTISWVRRTRVGGQWRDFVDATLGEQSEAYEVDIMNGSNVARTLTGLGSATASYPAAQQTSDFGSLQSSVSVRVYQISTVVGRGYPGSAVL